MGGNYRVDSSHIMGGRTMNKDSIIIMFSTGIDSLWSMALIRIVLLSFDCHMVSYPSDHSQSF
jgi:hypothetical protein